MTLAILGAGPAGVGAAYQAAQRKLGRVVVLEQRDTPGGNAGSFDIEGIRVDFGSHRLHPSCDARVLADLQRLLGDDLLSRPRHGRILLRNRWIHFPLRALDLAWHLPPDFLVGAALDVVRKRAPATFTDESFASVLEAGLGRTICRDFYFPFARKLWGLDPGQLSPIQARRRVSANSTTRMLRKILRIPGSKPVGFSSFYYPRNGYGQLTEAMCHAALDSGAEFCFGSRVGNIEHHGRRVQRIHYEKSGSSQALECDFVLSTLPMNLLARSMQPPPAVAEAATRLSFRGMILIYLVLEQAQFTEFDAHYFPGENIPISRLSEPKNYSAVSEPRDVTVLCAELPCSVDSSFWKMTDAELGEFVAKALGEASLPVQVPIRKVVTRRLAHAYPVYRRGFESDFDIVDHWLEQFENLVTFGRQGLFAHDNAHHGLHMSYCAVDCFEESGRFQWDRWHGFRKEFEANVVED